MAKNPLDKTKGLYVPDPTEQKKSKGVLKKVLLISAVAAVVIGIGLGSFFGGRAYQKGQDEPVGIIIEDPTVGPIEKPTPTPDGEDGDIIDIDPIILPEDSQMMIASKIYTDLRASIDHDITSLVVEGSRMVQEGDEAYLQAYISILEGEGEEQKEVLYVVGYADIADVKDIASAQVRKVKAGTVADIQKYISIESYIDSEEKLAKAKEYIEGRDSITGIEDLYVRISESNKKGKYSATIDYVAALASNELSLGSMKKEGNEFKGSYTELLEKAMGLNEVTKEVEMTR